MLALGASLVLRAAAYSLTEAGEPYNVIAPPKMLTLLGNATTHSRVDCGALLKESECLKALQHKAEKGVDLFQMLQDVSKKEAVADEGKAELKAKRRRRKLMKKRKILAAKKRKDKKLKAMIKKVKAQRASSGNATQAVADAIHNETHQQQRDLRRQLQQQPLQQPQQGEGTDESKMTVAQKAKREKEKSQAAQKEARQQAREQRKRLHTPGGDWNSTTPTACWSMNSQASGEWCNSNCQAGGGPSECASWCCCQVACNGWTEKSMPPSMKQGAQNSTLPEPAFQGVPWGEAKKARRAQKRLSQRRKKEADKDAEPASKEGEPASKGEEKNEGATKPNRKETRKDRKAAKKRVHFDSP